MEQSAPTELKAAGVAGDLAHFPLTCVDRRRRLASLDAVLSAAFDTEVR